MHNNPYAVNELARLAKQPKETGMLVLSRHKNESIVVGDNVEIVVVEIRGDKVRLGIEAPSNVPVHRREVYDAIIAKDGKNAPGAKQG